MSDEKEQKIPTVTTMEAAVARLCRPTRFHVAPHPDPITDVQYRMVIEAWTAKDRQTYGHIHFARMAAFLLDISSRYARRGFSAHRFNLTMTRTEIANYLRMAPETASRVLRRLSDEEVIAVKQREIILLQPERLALMAATDDASE